MARIFKTPSSFHVASLYQEAPTGLVVVVVEAVVDVVVLVVVVVLRVGEVVRLVEADVLVVVTTSVIVVVSLPLCVTVGSSALPHADNKPIARKNANKSAVALIRYNRPLQHP